MESPYNKLKSIVFTIISDAVINLGYNIQDTKDIIEFSKGFGDISCSIAFKLSKELKTNPITIATKIAKNIKQNEHIKEIKVENGFINFYIDREWFAKETLKFIFEIEKKSSLSNIGKNMKVIIEYPSANPVHPIHIGQLRNALLGDTLANIYDMCEYRVEREDYIDDLGLQMVEALWGYINLNPKNDQDLKFDHLLGRIYVDINEYMKSHDINDQLNILAKKIEEEGTVEASTRRKVAERCVMAQYQTLFDYKIYHNLMIWESDIVSTRMLDEALNILSKNKIIEKVEDGEYKGCTIINLKNFEGLPSELYTLKNNIKVLIRSNGTPTYLAKDIAFHMYKFGIIKNVFKYKKIMQKQENNKPLYTTYYDGESFDFANAKKIINIIDYRQNYPQLLLKAVLEKIDEKLKNNIIHLSYGTVGFEGVKLAGRKGTWIGNTADDLLIEAMNKAFILIKDRFKLSDIEKKEIARKVALAAIKFEFFKISPEKNIVFSWNRALNFEGDSGPYCQYMNARSVRLLKDSKFDFTSININNLDTKFITNDIEFELIKELSQVKEIVEKCSIELRPNIITDYIIRLATLFSKFYSNSLILKVENKDEQIVKLALTNSFSIIITKMLNILGIEAVERM